VDRASQMTIDCEKSEKSTVGMAKPTCRAESDAKTP
jgi:hypothetical protein